MYPAIIEELAKIEDVTNLDKVDTLISEPIGVLLVHERMIESYLDARDRFLMPGGAMVPSSGTIYVAPFSDSGLWTQTMAKGSLNCLTRSSLLGTARLFWSGFLSSCSRSQE